MGIKKIKFSKKKIEKNCHKNKISRLNFMEKNLKQNFEQTYIEYFLEFCFNEFFSIKLFPRNFIFMTIFLHLKT